MKDSPARRGLALRPFVATAEQAVFAFLARNCQRSYYDSEVSFVTGISRGAVNLALRGLAAAGLLEAEARGRMRFYRVRLEEPRVRAFKALLNVAGLSPLVARLARAALRVVLFGSAAEGRNLPESDVDLLVVTNDPDRVRRLLLRRPNIQAVVVTPSGLADLERDEPVFAGQLKRGVELWKQ